MRSATLLSCALCAGLSSSAFAGYNIEQGTGIIPPAMIDFEGLPAGNVAPDTYAPLGLANLDSGVGGGLFVAGFGNGTSTNSALGSFGVFMNFSTDVDAVSFQLWDPSGPSTPFGGGVAIFVFNDGDGSGSDWVDAWPLTPTGPGSSVIDVDINITSDSGMVFDEVRIIGNGFPADTFVDNISFNAVPEPASLGMLALAGLATLRRRR